MRGIVMTWEIALGIFALVAGIATVVGPILKLTQTITRLSVLVEDLTRRIERIEKSYEAK